MQMLFTLPEDGVPMQARKWNPEPTAPGVLFRSDSTTDSRESLEVIP
jgi:hypothetical protein